MHSNSMQSRDCIRRSKLHPLLGIENHHAIANARHHDTAFVFTGERESSRSDHFGEASEHIQIGALKYTVLPSNNLIGITSENSDRPAFERDGNARFTNWTFNRARRNFSLREGTSRERLSDERSLGSSDNSAHPVIGEKRLTRCRTNLPKYHHRVLVSCASVTTEKHEIGETQISEQPPRTKKTLEVISLCGRKTRSLFSELRQIGHESEVAGSARAETDSTFAIRGTEFHVGDLR